MSGKLGNGSFLSLPHHENRVWDGLRTSAPKNRTCSQGTNRIISGSKYCMLLWFLMIPPCQTVAARPPLPNIWIQLVKWLSSDQSRSIHRGNPRLHRTFFTRKSCPLSRALTWCRGSQPSHPRLFRSLYPHSNPFGIPFPLGRSTGKFIWNLPESIFSHGIPSGKFMKMQAACRRGLDLLDQATSWWFQMRRETPSFTGASRSQSRPKLQFTIPS